MNAPARSYVDAVERAWEAERRVTDRTEFSEAVARGLHRLTAYKDEYEVARMLTDRAFLAQIEVRFPNTSRLTYRLHPPALRALGRKSKIGITPAFHPFLRLLARGRFLRGTRLDVFGYSRVRRIERALAYDYADMVDRLAGALTTETYDSATAAAAAADLVKGYEGIKLKGVERYREALAALGVDCDLPPTGASPS